MATTPGPGNPNVNDGNPTFPAGAVINNGSGPTTVTAPNQNGGSTLPTPAQSAANSNPGPNGAPGGGATVANPTPNLANPDGTTSPFYSRINTAPDGSGTTASSTDGNGNPYAGTGESESDIEAQQLAEKQAQIDQINSTYDKQISDMTAQQNSEGQTRSRNLEALAAFSGLGGSPTAASEKAGSDSTTSAAINSNSASINSARSTALSGVYNTVDSDTQAVLKAQAANDTTAENTAIANAKDNATAVIDTLAKTLGSTGAAQTWAQVKSADPDLVAQIEKNTGMTDWQLQYMYNNALPANQKVTYDYTTIPGYALYTDPATNKPIAVNLGVTVPKGYSLTMAPDGTPLLFNSSTGDVKVATGFTQGELAKPPTPSAADTTASTKAAQTAAATKIESVMQSIVAQGQQNGQKDSFISPSDWASALQEWTAAGYSTTDFVNEFKGYANTKDPTQHYEGLD